MAKNVTSRDPRKPAIVAAMKAKSGARRITLLKEISPGVYRGNGLPMYAYVEVTQAELDGLSAEAALNAKEAKENDALIAEFAPKAEG